MSGDAQRIVENLVFEFQQLLTDSGYGQIATIVKSLDEFFQAENYHQDYIAKNPNGYCPDHSTGVTFNKSEKDISDLDPFDNSSLLKGKHILVIVSDGYCPYCEKFEKDIENSMDYQPCDQCGNWNHNYIYLKKEKNNE